MRAARLHSLPGGQATPVSIIETEKLTKRYGRRVGVEALDLRVGEGTVHGFLGPNGSGKTTTIRLLLGLMRSSAGRAKIFGRDCWRDAHVIKREVGYLPGDLRLYSWLTGRSALRLFSTIRKRDIRRQGAQLAEEFELELNVRARFMSRGMRQKLGLILALAHEPRLLVLDEPTTALDPIMQDRLNGRLRRMSAAGHTVFFSSHTLSEVEQLCDRVAILREGRLITDEALDDLRARARREVIIRWQPDHEPAPGVAPAFLTLVDAQKGEWRCTLSGNADRLVQWLADRPVGDVSIGRPDLETIFRDYYSRMEAL